MVEVKNDCLIINGGVTGQTSCPGPITLISATDQVFNVGGGALITTCTFVDSALSPLFFAESGLGPTHIQTPQFNDTANAAESANSFGGGASVTYGAGPPGTMTDTTKASFRATFVGKKIQSKFNTGTIASTAGGTITLTAAWSPSTPAAGDPYQIEPCTDNIAGTTQTVTFYGWGTTLLDQPTDEGSPEGLGSSAGCPAAGTALPPVPPAPAGCDVLTVNVPVAGAVIYESPGGCVITVNPSGPGKFTVDGKFDDNTTLTVDGTAVGTDHASQIPVNIAAGGVKCPPLGPATAYYTGTFALSAPVRDG
jgi:hypothetical protein